jgi:hypothetical protein
MKVVKKNDIIEGLRKLGLYVEVAKTKVKEWERIHVHVVVRETTKEGCPLMRYICKISLHHGLLNTYTFKGLPDYYCYAIRLMLEKAVILNHINYLALGVKAYNNTLELKERADAETDKKLKHKATLHYHWEKKKRFTSLFTERYYGGVTPKGNTRYDI